MLVLILLPGFNSRSRLNFFLNNFFIYYIYPKISLSQGDVLSQNTFHLVSLYVFIFVLPFVFYVLVLSCV